MTWKAAVLIPSYNTGPALLRATVEGVLQQTDTPICLVLDGSDDGSAAVVDALAGQHPERIRSLKKPTNEGKGAAVRSGAQLLQKDGFTHVLVMDADGQHPADRIDDFLGQSEASPDSMVLGQPVFDASVPLERLYGRKLSVWLVAVEVGGGAVGDPLYGFRVYPIAPLLDAMGERRANRYDFDPEVAVRMCWAGVPTVKVPARVAYLNKDDGGVSHFHYLRDNARFIWVHTRLLAMAPFFWLFGKRARSVPAQ